jgi:hypothetical protein
MLPESSMVKNTLGSTMVDRYRGAVASGPGAAKADWIVDILKTVVETITASPLISFLVNIVLILIK